MFGFSLISEDFYISIGNEIKIKKQLMSAIQKAGELQGINVIDYDSLDLLSTRPAINFSMNDYLTPEEKIEELEEEILDLQEDRENGLFPALTFEESMEFYNSRDMTPEEKLDIVVDRRIKKLKEEIEEIKLKGIEKPEKTDPEKCFPKLVMRSETTYQGFYKLDSHFYRDSDSESINYSDIYTREFTEKNFTDYMVKYIAAFFPALKTTEEKLPPEIVDTRYIKIEKSTKRSNMAEIAPRDDFSFVLRRGNIVEEYSPNWELKYNYSTQLPEVEGPDEWEPNCYDGKNILFGNVSYPVLYRLTDNHQLQKKDQYKIPSTNVMVKYRFLSNGEPYVIEQGDNVQIHLLEENKTIATRDLGFAYVNYVLNGPDNTFWIGRSGGAVCVYSKEGELKKIIHINGREESEFRRSVFAILSDGSFLAYDNEDIVRYNNDGQRIWSFTRSASFYYNQYVNSRNGMYYFYNNSEKSITRLVEVDAKIPKTLTLIKEANTKLANANMNETAEVYLNIADAYYADKAYESAKTYYELYLQISPANPKAAEKRLNCEIILNKQIAKSKTESAINLYDEYGEETAKTDYQEAMKLLEKLKKQVPWDQEVQELYADLKNTFSPADAVTKNQKLSLEVTEVDLTALFPALISVYAAKPSGFIEVKNTSSKSIKNITASSNIRKYMDYPSVSEPVPELKAGEKINIPVLTVLNQNVLKVNEATPVQIQFTLKWEEDNKSYSTNITRTVTIYKKSALSWADTAMASCFVLPNDPSVSDFIFNALNCKMENLFSVNLTKAIKIADALGSIPLNYISDPVTPAAQVIDNEYAIDTIRYPSETLRLKGGDCDDMTTLFCSLLEGTNVDTAFITSPGHIFAAFNSGLDYSEIWSRLDNEHKVINVAGKAWIPIECTSLNQGFNKAWENASKLIKEESYEVTTLASAWETYSPVPAETEKADINLNTDSLNKMNSSNRNDIFKCITNAMEKTEINKASEKDLNQLAKMYHSSGNDDKAIEVLLALTNKHPDYYKGYRNLSMLYESKGDSKKAKAYQQKAAAYASKTQKDKQADSRAGDSNELEWED